MPVYDDKAGYWITCNISVGRLSSLGTIHYRVVEFPPAVLWLLLKLKIAYNIFSYDSIFFPKIYKKWSIGKNTLGIFSEVDHSKNKKACKYTKPSGTCLTNFIMSANVYAELCF